MPDREVVVLSGVRTAVGTYGGTLKDQPLVDMAAKVVQEAVQSCLLYTSPSPRDTERSRMPSSA